MSQALANPNAPPSADMQAKHKLYYRLFSLKILRPWYISNVSLVKRVDRAIRIPPYDYFWVDIDKITRIVTFGLGPFDIALPQPALVWESRVQSNERDPAVLGGPSLALLESSVSCRVLYRHHEMIELALYYPYAPNCQRRADSPLMDLFFCDPRYTQEMAECLEIAATDANLAIRTRAYGVGTNWADTLEIAMSKIDRNTLVYSSQPNFPINAIMNMADPGKKPAAIFWDDDLADTASKWHHPTCSYVLKPAAQWTSSWSLHIHAKKLTNGVLMANHDSWGYQKFCLDTSMNDQDRFREFMPNSSAIFIRKDLHKPSAWLPELVR
ncbi:hypothetical protein B0H63DRAFT_445500 [Podospora didyma]|uniref:Uncharacterized protein n=1 Tax=Podospora didyma TaxID=330526 RepID=A0AAE0NXA2_9PEZI|nr:hypothetical protein B0H63DRAFT_445500 [Podospora didyma]